MNAGHLCGAQNRLTGSGRPCVSEAASAAGAASAGQLSGVAPSQATGRAAKLKGAHSQTETMLRRQVHWENVAAL